MEIQIIITTLSMLVTLVTAGFMLYKSWKKYPKEKKIDDVELSQKYNDLATSAFTRAEQAEQKASEAEKVIAGYETTIKDLKVTVEDHEKEIISLKTKVAEQEVDLILLRKKIIAQDVEIIELKKSQKENGNA
jgi:hypothetical protein